MQITLFTFLLICLCVYFFLKAIEEVVIFFNTLLCSFKRIKRGSSSIHPPVEIPEEPPILKPKYDVDAFRGRMKKLKVDKDKLREVIDRDYRGTSGTEIISQEYEIDMERRLNI